MFFFCTVFRIKNTSHLILSHNSVKFLHSYLRLVESSEEKQEIHTKNIRACFIPSNEADKQKYL